MFQSLCNEVHTRGIVIYARDPTEQSCTFLHEVLSQQHTHETAHPLGCPSVKLQQPELTAADACKPSVCFPLGLLRVLGFWMTAFQAGTATWSEPADVKMNQH